MGDGETGAGWISMEAKDRSSRDVVTLSNAHPVEITHPRSFVGRINHASASGGRYCITNAATRSAPPYRSCHTAPAVAPDASIYNRRQLVTMNLEREYYCFVMFMYIASAFGDMTHRASESVRRLYQGLHSFRNLRRMEASFRKARALRLRFSQSLASRCWLTLYFLRIVALN
jgi:hypothetical protein